MTTPDASHVELLYRALQARIGIVVSTSDPERLRAKLYAARRSTADPSLEVLTILPSRQLPNAELWIVKQGASSDPTESPDAPPA